MKKLFTCAAVAVAALASMSAQAVTVSFGGQAATDGSGTTSSRITASNQLAYGSGYFIETFDPATRMTGLPPGLEGPGANIPGQIELATGCSFNSYNALDITVTGGGFKSVKGPVGDRAAPPAGDTTCYGVSPIPYSADTGGSVTIDYSALLVGGEKINYLGLYYGSIDTYNDLVFYRADGSTFTVEGAWVLSQLGGTSGGQQGAGSNVYVNLVFDDSEVFTKFEFITTGIAVEVDNIVVGTNRVPEPASLALLGLGLAGLGLSRRRKAAK